ncbi:MAG: phospholipase D-like domain-containing protein [Patescibacteria group bacterium]|nr:phospholipase D-like domain-containing protein [Patescibacteria group bacterium]
MNNLILNCTKKLLHLSPDLVQSQLFDETTFYPQFIKDLKSCQKEVIIESPFITSLRAGMLLRYFENLVNKKVKAYIVTRDPNDHDTTMKEQAEKEIRRFETMGIQVLVTTNFSHRKLAILDRTILYEVSLNILSQNCSREIMRRINSKTQTEECFRFIDLGKFIY